MSLYTNLCPIDFWATEETMKPIKFKDLTIDYVQVITLGNNTGTYSVLEFGCTRIHNHIFVKLLRISDGNGDYDTMKVMNYDFDNIGAMEVFCDKPQKSTRPKKAGHNSR